MTVYRKNISINVGETFSENLTLLSADGTGVVDLTGLQDSHILENMLQTLVSQIYKLVL